MAPEPLQDIRFSECRATTAGAGAPPDKLCAAPDEAASRLVGGDGAEDALASRLRIAAIDPELKFGGGEAQVLGLARELVNGGQQVEVWCDPRGELWRRAAAAGIVCCPLRIRNALDVAAGLRLRALLSAGRCDVVHFHTARAHALAPYARGRARALIVTRRMDYVPNRLFAPWLYNRVVDAVVAISAGVARALMCGGVSRERITIISSGVDCDRFAPADAAGRQQARAALGLQPEDVVVGALGALVPRKGHSLLLEAMELASGWQTDRPVRGPLRCLIGGAGPLYPQLSARIARSRLEHCVRLVGPVKDPASFFAALDLFVMPSLHEGLGVAALEAMASGLPLIVSAVGGLVELVCDGASGVLVEVGQADALARAIAQLAARPELRRAMGAAGRERTVKSFALRAMARATLRLYRGCLAGALQARG